MKKTILVLSLVCILCAYIVTPANAEITTDNVIVKDENIRFESPDILADIGTVSIKYSIIIDQEQNNLYPTFDNSEAALQNFKIFNAELLNEIKTIYGLEELSNETWFDYKNCFYKYLNNPSKLKEYTEGNEDVILFNIFMDYYENESDNAQIIEYLSNKTADQLKSDGNFVALMPYTTPIVSAYQKAFKNSQIKGKLGCSVMRLDDSTTKAVAYAYQYASNRNYDNYQSFASDCTNFVSQILEASGRAQDSVWWHTKSALLSHRHSDAWVNANAFVNYFGTVYESASHYGFSAYLKAGDYIALDQGGEGNWDHCGFCVASDNYLTGDYYDYLVAQHSADYLAWASSSTCGWDEQENGVNRFAVIRP